MSGVTVYWNIVNDMGLEASWKIGHMVLTKEHNYEKFYNVGSVEPEVYF